MQEYIGQPCIVCGEAFTEQDDIVTCPDCGTPYHRACWKQNGACINTALHEQGTSWIKQYQEQEKERLAQKRRDDEAEQAAAREFGESPALNPELYDGIHMSDTDPCLGLDPEEQLDGITVAEASAFIRTNTFYYLPLFRLMKRTGKKISVNLLSLLCPHFYCANRKMWGSAMAALLLNTLLEIPSVIMLLHKQMDVNIPWANVETSAFQVIYVVSFFLYIALSVIWGLRANYMYYRFAQRKIQSIRQESATPEMKQQKISAAGGTSLLNVMLILGMQFLITRVMGFLLLIVR